MKIALLGCGTVGSGVVEIAEKLEQITLSKILVRKVEDMKDERFTCQFEDILNDPEIEVVVEAIGGLHPAHEYIMAALQANKHVVSANKAVIAEYYQEFIDTAKAHHVCFQFEASTGGGIPWIKNLSRYARMDEIMEISGIFNGTSNYILDKMTKTGADFDVVLKEAQQLGYAEQDPSADIDGLDVLNKTIISAGVAHHAYINKEAIPVYGIRTIQSGDIEAFKRKHLTCRLLAVIRKQADDVLSVYIEPALVNANSIEAAVPDNFNLCTLAAPTIGELKFYGQGAGKLPTANAMIQDILDIHSKEAMLNQCVLDRNMHIDNRLEMHTYYVRSQEACEQLEAISLSNEPCADGWIYHTRKISVHEMHTLAKQLQADGLHFFMAAVCG